VAPTENVSIPAKVAGHVAWHELTQGPDLGHRLRPDFQTSICGRELDIYLRCQQVLKEVPDDELLEW
jgi:hypothetical protein